MVDGIEIIANAPKIKLNLGKRMKKVLWAFIAFLVLTGGYAGARLFWLDQPKGQISSQRLSCSASDYRNYVKIMVQTGEMTIGLDSDSGTDEQQARMLAAYDALNLSGPQTVIVSAYVPEADLYTQVCAAEKCTMEELFAPRTACLTERFNDCTYLALRFKEQDYCLIAPSEEE